MAWSHLKACEGHLQWHGRIVADAQDVDNLKQPPQRWKVELGLDRVLVVPEGLHSSHTADTAPGTV
jgi:hypothetical protein